MKLLEQFKHNVLEHDNDFICEEDRHVHQFMQCHVGKAKFIYGNYGLGTEFTRRLDNQMVLVAIVSAGNVYIVDKFKLNIWSGNFTGSLPNNMFFIDNYACTINDLIEKTVFAEFCKTLEYKEFPELKEECRKEARRSLIYGKETKFLKYIQIGFVDLVVSYLCGDTDIFEYAMNHYNAKREEYNQKYSFDIMVENLKSGEQAAKKWEVEMATNLRDSKAKTVTVYFSKNGESANEKVPVSEILSLLTHNDYFSSYSFMSNKKGKAILAELKIPFYGNGEEQLRCSDITKIMYGNKILYLKER